MLFWGCGGVSVEVHTFGLFCKVSPIDGFHCLPFHTSEKALTVRIGSLKPKIYLWNKILS